MPQPPRPVRLARISSERASNFPVRNLTDSFRDSSLKDPLTTVCMRRKSHHGHSTEIYEDEDEAAVEVRILTFYGGEGMEGHAD